VYDYNIFLSALLQPSTVLMKVPLSITITQVKIFLEMSLEDRFDSYSYLDLSTFSSWWAI